MKEALSRLEKTIIDENNSCWFETPINSKITDSLLINLTRSPRKKGSRGTPPPPHTHTHTHTPHPLPSMGVWIFSGTTQLVQRKIDR